MAVVIALVRFADDAAYSIYSWTPDDGNPQQCAWITAHLIYLRDMGRWPYDDE